jgi:hypothetical protein
MPVTHELMAIGVSFFAEIVAERRRAQRVGKAPEKDQICSFDTESQEPGAKP